MSVEDVANALQRKFLAGGNFVLAGPAGTIGVQVAPAAAVDIVDDFEEQGFAGLAVQAVGYEVGVDEPKIHVYITKGSKRVERTITDGGDEISVEISRVGKVSVRPEAASTAVNRGHMFIHGNRIACGSSCAPAIERYAGTLGALITLNGAMHILSNNHVLAACNHTPIGAPILSPSARDAGPNIPAPLAIATHARMVELRSGVPDFVNPCHEDVAAARVTDPNLVSSRQGSGADSYDTPHLVTAPITGVRVKKFGRTTALTSGTIEAKALPFAMPYKSSLFSATVWFTDVWIVRADAGDHFALPGDSGSLVVTEDGSRSVGLIFAATPAGDFGYMVPIEHVLACLGNASLVRGHHA